MRRSALLAATLLVAACGSRAEPYRFMSPMVAGAEIRAAGPVAPPPPVRAPIISHRRTATAITIAPAGPPPAAIASGAAAAQVPDVVSTRLRSPHRAPGEPPPTLHEPADLRAWIGRRDRRPPVTAALAWAAELGHAIDARSGADLLAWASAEDRLADAEAPPRPGDLLVFDFVEGAPADLVAVVIARDDRGVTELAYLGGGVVRRGFLDRTRKSLRRASDGAVVNTYLRTGKRWPPAGTHYLAGELLAHVVHLS